MVSLVLQAKKTRLMFWSVYIYRVFQQIRYLSEAREQKRKIKYITGNRRAAAPSFEGGMGLPRVAWVGDWATAGSKRVSFYYHLTRAVNITVLVRIYCTRVFVWRHYAASAARERNNHSGFFIKHFAQKGIWVSSLILCITETFRRRYRSNPSWMNRNAQEISC